MGQKVVKIKKPMQSRKQIFKQRRLIIGFGCIGLAIVLMVIGTTVGSNNDVCEIVIAAEFIPKGTLITNEHLKTVQSTDASIAQNYFSKTQYAENMYTTVDIIEGGFISANCVSDKPLNADRVSIDNLPKGKAAISIFIKNNAANVAYKLKPYDIVTVYAVKQSNNQDEEITKMSQKIDALQYVQILSVTLGSEESETGEILDTQTITFIADEVQAPLLAAISNNYNPHLSLVYRGDNEECNSLLEIQNQINEEIKAAAAQELEQAAATQGGEIFG